MYNQLKNKQMNRKLKLGLTLFALGFLGVLTMLTVTLPLGDLPEQIAQLPPFTIKLITLVNPTIFLLIAVVVGTALYDKVNLSIPTITSLLKIESHQPQTSFVQQLKYGVSLGLLAGTAVMLINFIFASVLSEQFQAYYSQLEITLLARFGYGGITEELLLRFGLMTLLVWIIFKLTKKLNNAVYWTAIVISTVLFAVGHFPAVYAVISNPTTLFLTFVLVGNSIVGLVLGWLYWKKGLEAAIIAHIFTHVALVSLGLFL